MSTPGPSASVEPSREELVKHLEFIQAIIARQASNAFLLKTWSVTLVAALFALAAKDVNASFAYLALVPVLMFWGLDAYYLWQEKRFRDLYNWVRLGMKSITLQQRDEIGPFILQPSKVPRHHRSRRANWPNALFSRTIWPFYMVLALCIIGAARLALPAQAPPAKSQAPSKASSLELEDRP